MKRKGKRRTCLETKKEVVTGKTGGRKRSYCNTRSNAYTKEENFSAQQGSSAYCDRLTSAVVHHSSTSVVEDTTGHSVHTCKGESEMIEEERHWAFPTSLANPPDLMNNDRNPSDDDGEKEEEEKSMMVIGASRQEKERRQNRAEKRLGRSPEKNMHETPLMKESEQDPTSSTSTPPSPCISPFIVALPALVVCSEGSSRCPGGCPPTRCISPSVRSLRSAQRPSPPLTPPLRAVVSPGSSHTLSFSSCHFSPSSSTLHALLPSPQVSSTPLPPSFSTSTSPTSPLPDSYAGEKGILPCEKSRITSAGEEEKTKNNHHQQKKRECFLSQTGASNRRKGCSRDSNSGSSRRQQGAPSPPRLTPVMQTSSSSSMPSGRTTAEYKRNENMNSRSSSPAVYFRLDSLLEEGLTEREEEWRKEVEWKKKNSRRKRGEDGEKEERNYARMRGSLTHHLDLSPRSDHTSIVKSDTKWKRQRDDTSTRRDTTYDYWCQKGEEEKENEKERISSPYMLPPSALGRIPSLEESSCRNGMEGGGGVSTETRREDHSRDTNNKVEERSGAACEERRSTASGAPENVLDSSSFPLVSSPLHMNSAEGRRWTRVGKRSSHKEGVFCNAPSPSSFPSDGSECQYTRGGEDSKLEDEENEEDIALHMIASAAMHTGFENTGNDCYACSVLTFLLRNTLLRKTLCSAFHTQHKEVEKWWKKWMKRMLRRGDNGTEEEGESMGVTRSVRENESRANECFSEDSVSPNKKIPEDRKLVRALSTPCPVHFALRRLIFEIEKREYLFKKTLKLLRELKEKRDRVKEKKTRQHMKRMRKETTTSDSPPPLSASSFNSFLQIPVMMSGSEAGSPDEVLYPSSKTVGNLSGLEKEERAEEEDKKEFWRKGVCPPPIPAWYFHLVQRVLGIPRTPLSPPLPAPASRKFLPLGDPAKPNNRNTEREKEDGLEQQEQRDHGPESHAMMMIMKREEGRGGENESPERKKTINFSLLPPDGSSYHDHDHHHPHQQHYYDSGEKASRKRDAWSEHVRRQRRTMAILSRRALFSIVSGTEFSTFRKGVSLAPLRHALNEEGIFFSGYQEDAHEFFVYLVDLLEKEAKEGWSAAIGDCRKEKDAPPLYSTSPPRSRSRTQSPPPASVNHSAEPEGKNALPLPLRDGESRKIRAVNATKSSPVWIHELIQGKLLNLVRCRNANCQHETVTVETFINLGFSLSSVGREGSSSCSSSSSASLLSTSSLLEETLKYEALEGYLCDACHSSLHQYQGACFFGVPPPLLIFQIKRFTAEFDKVANSMIMRKDCTPVCLSDIIEVTALSDKKCMSSDRGESTKRKAEEIQDHQPVSTSHDYNDDGDYYYNDENKVLHDALRQREAALLYDTYHPQQCGQPYFNKIIEGDQQENDEKQNSHMLHIPFSQVEKNHVHVFKGIYRLQAVLEHHGSSMQHGHYTCAFASSSSSSPDGPSDKTRQRMAQFPFSSSFSPSGVPGKNTGLEESSRRLDVGAPSALVAWQRANDSTVGEIKETALRGLLHSSTDCYLILYERQSLEETLGPIKDVMPPLPPLM